MPALPWNMSLTAAASKSFFLSMRELKAECTASSSLSIFSLVSTASRLLPFSRLSRAFHSPGVQESLQLNCAIVRLRVIRPMIRGLAGLVRARSFFR